MTTKDDYFDEYYTVTSLPEVYVFRFSKQNRTLRIPDSIDYIRHDNLIPSLNSIYFPFFLQGYSIEPRTSGRSISIDFRIQRSKTAYRETKYSQTGYFYWEETTVSTHRFPNNVGNISFNLIASGIINEPNVTELCLDITINGKYIKRVQGGKYLGTFGDEKLCTVQLEDMIDISNLSLQTENILEIRYGRIVGGAYKNGIVFSGVNGSMLDYIFYEFDKNASYKDAFYINDINFYVDLVYFHPSTDL